MWNISDYSLEERFHQVCQNLSRKLYYNQKYSRLNRVRE
nr:MAG TPA: hypothetical protein [Caudoviricetes sp.]